MAKNILVISCDIAETRVALIECGIIDELHIERRVAQPRGGTVGDIYLRAKVTRVLPGLQAAFVDIGLERAAFLHVEDLIRPNDFEAYLAGGRKHALGADNGAGVREGHGDADAAEADPDASGESASVDVQIADPPAGSEIAEEALAVEGETFEPLDDREEADGQGAGLTDELAESEVEESDDGAEAADDVEEIAAVDVLAVDDASSAQLP